MVGRDALAHHPSGHRYELQIEILDAELIDLRPHLPDQVVATARLGEFLIVGGHALLSQTFL
jgi:hypothetical protein